MRNLFAVLLTAAVFPIGASAASAAGPDLIVPSGAISVQIPGIKNVFLRSYTLDFIWSHQTHNIGNAAAPASVTAVEIDSKRPTPGGLLAVPKLPPNYARASTGRFQINFANWEFGTHPAKICADVRKVVTESNEGNNCRQLAPVHVVPSRFVGRISGKLESLPPAHTFNTSWSADVELTRPRVRLAGNPAIVDYTFKIPSVIYNVKGTESLSNCSYNGSKTDHPATADQLVRLKFAPDSGRYIGDNTFTPGFTIMVKVQCPGSPAANVPFPVTHQWFYTDGFRAFQNPGLEALRGIHIFFYPDGVKATWTWNLEAVE
jgi:hypothetical protein